MRTAYGPSSSIGFRSRFPSILILDASWPFLADPAGIPPQGFKEAFVEADAEGKARILQVLLKKATLRGKEWEFEYNQPVDVLFSIGELYFKKRMWGE
jgi:hypothetical protein